MIIRIPILYLPLVRIIYVFTLYSDDEETDERLHDTHIAQSNPESNALSTIRTMRSAHAHMT